MQVSIGLPATIPGVHRDLIFDWARKADASLFASVGILDRLVYPNYESLMTLAAVASITQRVRLMTTILIAPLRNAGILAKQAATLDALSGGRLTLGLAVGSREDDFRAAPASFPDRGKRFDQQLATMRRIWSGHPLSDDIGPIGPPTAQQNGPELLIGGRGPQALKRVGLWGDGFISGGGGPQAAQQGYTRAKELWDAEGRAGKPRFVACGYFGLGPNATEGIHSYIEHYYSFLGPMANQFANSTPATPQAVKDIIEAFTDVGVDEALLWPCIPALDQVDRLAELIG